MPRLAWYGAQSAARIQAAERVLGKTLDFRAVINDDSRAGYTDQDSYLFQNGYLGPLIAAGQPYREIWWSAPPFWKGANWNDAAKGSYDEDWKKLARYIVSIEARKGNISGAIRFRPAFEFNGHWFHWSVRGNYAGFIAGWRGMHDAFESVAPGRFRFEFAPTETSQYQGSFSDVERCWPGDAYVDDMGLDLYWKPFVNETDGWTQWGRDPNAAFNAALTSRYGLNWLERFAKEHGNKPMVLSEIGAQGGKNTSSETLDPTPYIQRLAEWCAARNVPVLWWNGTSTEGYLGDIISHNNWPKTRAAVKRYFADPATNGKGEGGHDTPTPTPTPSPEPTPVPDTPAAALLGTINAESYAQRDKLSGDAAALIRWVEDAAYWATKGAATAPAGKETDPLKALLAIYDRLTDAPTLPEPGESLIAGWIEQASPILDAAGLLEPDPEPQPEPGQDVAALRAEVAALRSQLAAEVAARQAVEGRLAVIRAALG